ncbi:MAG: dihydrodipicolinate synthase family protein [Burkholderiales bacterium]
MAPAACRDFSVRPITTVLLWDIEPAAALGARDELRAAGFETEHVANLQAAVRRADIVSCATLATSPIVQAEWLSENVHLDLIGSFTPAMQEAHPDCWEISVTQRADWRGVFPAVTTQFRDDYSVDFEATERVIARLVAEGVSGIVVCGTVGENGSLTREEGIGVMRAARSAVQRRVPIIAGIAEMSTQSACV